MELGRDEALLELRNGCTLEGPPDAFQIDRGGFALCRDGIRIEVHTENGVEGKFVPNGIVSEMINDGSIANTQDERVQFVFGLASRAG